MTYLPDFEKQLDGSRYAGLNCTCASGAMAADYNSLGHVKPSSSSVRTWTGDTSGGTNLAQVDTALRNHVGVDLDVRYRYPWTSFVSRIVKGEGAILQGYYAPIRDSRFRGSETFGGNHAIFVAPGFIGMDPLADGRRPGIYKYHGEPYPLALLRDFAGRLNVGSTSYVKLGAGLVYAAFTRDNTKDYRAQLPDGAFWVYTVSGGAITGRKSYTRGAGSSVPCSAPRLYPWSGHGSKSLVKVTKGIYEGRYISSLYAREV